MESKNVNLVYPEHIRQEIQSYIKFVAPPMTAEELLEDLSVLKDVDVLFTGWGGPSVDANFLDHAPHLKAVFHAAGSIKPIATEQVWKKGIKITSAYMANAVPVAEYTLSQILFSLKNGWQIVRDVKKNQAYPSNAPSQMAGSYNSVVGLISLSTIGRKVAQLLSLFDVKVIAYDPFVTEAEAAELSVELCALDDVFQKADVVSLHTPLLPETVGLITGSHLEKMKTHASFINTARGAIVKENEMIDVLSQRSDLTAIIDVTDPEPPNKDSLLYRLPNVVLTPHIAGSLGTECGRMGSYMVQELKRYLNGQPLKWGISEEKFHKMA